MVEKSRTEINLTKNESGNKNFACCQKCQKLVMQYSIPAEDFQHCNLKHFFCCDCIEKLNLDSCPICELPLDHKGKKTYFNV